MKRTMMAVLGVFAFAAAIATSSPAGADGASSCFAPALNCGGQTYSGCSITCYTPGYARCDRGICAGGYGYESATAPSCYCQ